MGATKEKRVRKDESPFRRKRKKSNTDVPLEMDSEEKTDGNFEENLTAELLDSKTIREGMLLFGCVTEIKSSFFVMSLPGCLFGIVPGNNISNSFTKSLEDCFENSTGETPSISSVIRVGMVFPCKVIQISQDPLKRKPSIILSINPQDINAELKPSSLYSKMVLYVSVSSIEDHGYIVDTGNKFIQGFLSRTGSDNSKDVFIGEVIPTCVKKINISSKSSAKIQLSRLDFSEEFPEISVEDIKLSSVLPGAKIRADVIDIQHPFVYMKFQCFDACANVLSLGSTYKAITAGTTIQGTVLYTHPITHMIYLMLNLKPSPEIFRGYFGLKKYMPVKSLKFQYFYRNCAYYRISKGTYGFINTRDLPNKLQISQSTANHLISKACVLFFHYMDNLVQMTAKPSMMEKNIILPEDVQTGDVYEAVVKKHFHDGMLVWICPGLFGFVRRIYMSDVYVTKPEVLHPVGSKVKCRVLSSDGKGKLNMTCKESLLNLQVRLILSSYDGVKRGQFYKGVVVQVTEAYILVLFFNDVKGVVPSSYIPNGSVYYEGQTVLCEVLDCNPLKKSLRLSLKTEKWCPTEDINESLNMPSENSVKVKKGKIPQTNKFDAKQTNIKSSQTLTTKDSLLPVKLSNTSESVPETVSGKSFEAVIIKVTGNQLNILLNGVRGRVHITQIGCMSEGIYPLKDFSEGQKISVYIIGDYVKKKRNYLEITHKNLISFKECSLKFPTVSLSQNLNDDSSLIGFVKEVYNTYAILWLSPAKTGVLDFLHFSENPKVVKKLRRHLKVGLALKVFILHQQQQSKKEKGAFSISLRKIEKKLPQVGENILGLVQIACAERGLILKLPFGYHGVTAITDLTDKYATLHTLLDEYRKLKFVLCHVLEVNHETKYCQLSLRKSRVYGKNINLNTSFCPEITKDCIVEGETVKGFVKSISDSAITVVFGRNLEGKVHIHNCSEATCGLCSFTKSVISRFPPGSVAEVVIEKKSADGESFILEFIDPLSLKNTRCNRLSITEDISWDDIE